MEQVIWSPRSSRSLGKELTIDLKSEDDAAEQLMLRSPGIEIEGKELPTDLKSADDAAEQLMLWSPEIEIEAIHDSSPRLKYNLLGEDEEMVEVDFQILEKAAYFRSADGGDLLRLCPPESKPGVVIEIQSIEPSPSELLSQIQPIHSPYHHNGRELMEAIEKKTWEEAKEMHLMNKKISKLPENPNCPKLNLLFLQANHHLRVIPSLFFQSMPVLQTLDLSKTRISSLPQSLFRLVQLRTFILRGCELFKELPDEVGQLCDLEVLDLEGTEIINFPITIRKMTKLTCLKVSFCEINHNRKNGHSNKIIPQNVISNLLQLEELSIDVNPDDERWNVTVKHIVNEICCLNWLRSLKLYLPEVVLLNGLSNIRLLSTNQSGRRFGLTVGNHLKCIIYRFPQKIAVQYEERKRCLKYVNGEGVPTEIKKVLRYATSLFLDRHITVTSLSDFGVENTKNLKFCILKECNEIQTIVGAGDERNVLGSLEYLNLHYLKNVKSISMSPLGQGSLFSLKALKLYSCPQLTTIFTLNLLGMLRNLEELVVEECPEIRSIVSLHDGQYQQQCFLPKLKKIALHYMPNLVSISSGVWIGQRLEWLSCYDCPSLKTLFPEELTSHDLKVVTGEAEWWSALKCNYSERFRPPDLDGIFVPIEKDTDLMTQLAKINDQLQAQKPKQKQEPKHSQQPGLGEVVAIEEQAQSRNQSLGFTCAILAKLKLLCNCFLCE